MSERAYLAGGGRLVHRYGPRVHVLSDVYALSLLANLCRPEVEQPRLNRLIEAGFRHLVDALVEQLPRAVRDVPTRLFPSEPRARFVGECVDPEARVVVVDVARGGMLPSYVVQMALLDVLAPSAVRVDHVYMQRISGADGRVTGVSMAGSKIGGDVEGVTMIVPDPMAATGRSIERLLRLYRAEVRGVPRRIVCAHLIVTPEYLRRVTAEFPEVEVYALRLDRGLSAPDVLAAVPGERWDEEVGLDPHDYIVPGAGGLGELINNAFV